MERQKIEDFKVEFIKGIAEIASARRQYSKAQDLYIDHLEQLLVQRVSNAKRTVCEQHVCVESKVNVGYRVFVNCYTLFPIAN